MSARPMVSFLVLSCLFACTAPAAPVDAYNVVWDTPSTDHHGTMPLGNGDIAASVWMSPDGDLQFYISKTDAWDDYARLLKVGKVRIRLEPNPLAGGAKFRQELNLNKGAVEIAIGERAETRLRVWVDANHPVIQVTAESEKPVEATAILEIWRTNQVESAELQTSDVLTNRKLPDGRKPVMLLEPDTVVPNQPGQIVWYHHNVKSVGPAMLAEVQGLTGFKQTDPILHRTFGGMITAAEGKSLDARRLLSPRGKRHQFSVVIQTVHPSTPEEWQAEIGKTAARVKAAGVEKRLQAHNDWWANFWNRSWIRATTGQAPPASAAVIVPVNRLPLCIGRDQSGGNPFKGELGRVSVFTKPMTGDFIAKLAAGGPREALDAKAGAVFSETGPAIGALAGLKELNTKDGLTLEAWVRPEALPDGGARLLDKISIGGSDGFLLDTYPGNSLRFICGEMRLEKAGAVPAGKWTHVAAVADAGAGGCRIYVNGKLAATEANEPARNEAETVSQMYHLQRFITACAGRGQFPIKFNGSIFTVPPGPTEKDPDYRLWGPGYWWQNSRLPYISLCASGDFDLQGTFFQMYARDLLPFNVYRTRHYLGHGGAYYPECIMFWGPVFSETYGWTPFEQRKDKLQESGWHKWEWVGGLELAWMMLDYYEHTQDQKFLRDTALPCTREVLTFFEEHYPVNAEGKLVFHPSQALETWWHCTNATPEVAGCIAVTERLLALPNSVLPESDRTRLEVFQKKLPPVPLREVERKTALAPAQFFAQKSNIENPELYPVFPFRLFAFNRPNAEWARAALDHRWDRGNSGWRQDDIFMAYLALTDDVRKSVTARARNHDRNERFPAFWGPNYDWTPDQDHGGVLMKTFQSMLLQTDGNKIFIRPAWPAQWDVEFKLHAPQKTVLQGRIRNGKVEALEVSPKERRADIVICE